MRWFVVARKTVADLSNPKILLGYAVPFLTVTGFLILGLTSDLAEADGLTLAQQELEVATIFLVVAYILSAGIPFLGLVAIFCANTFAKEAETGALRILLSKPRPRWRIYCGTAGAVVGYATLVGVASLLVSGALIVSFGEISAAAIPAGILEPLAGTVLFAAFGAAVVTAIGLALSVVTKNRLRTALGTLAVPALYFAYLPIRIFAPVMYEDYHLYVLDVGYHFGNAFIVIHEAVGDPLPVETQLALAPWSGVYAFENVEEPLPETLETAGHVSMELSVALLAGVAVLAFLFGLRRFQTMDV